MSKGRVKLGSRVKEDAGPGQFITKKGLREMMLEQRRAFIGGKRSYGREYDDFYQNRRWLTPSGSRSPTFLPVKTQLAINKLAKKMVDTAASTGDRPAQAGFGQLTVSETQTLRGIGLGRVMDAYYGRDVQEGPVRQFLTPCDLPGGGMGALGQDDLPPPESVDVVTAVREIYGTAISVKPLAEFIGEHPIMSTAAFMMVVGIWAGIASFIGAGGVDVLKEIYLKK